jgi:hypothetical protein
MLFSLGPSKLSPTFDPLRLLFVLEPPEVEAFGLTGTPNELTVKDAERLQKRKNLVKFQF